MKTMFEPCLTVCVGLLFAATSFAQTPATGTASNEMDLRPNMHCPSWIQEKPSRKGGFRNPRFGDNCRDNKKKAKASCK
jgi:hypothetical protein